LVDLRQVDTVFVLCQHACQVDTYLAIYAFLLTSSSFFLYVFLIFWRMGLPE
jgi:hypothetical protein